METPEQKRKRILYKKFKNSDDKQGWLKYIKTECEELYNEIMDGFYYSKVFHESSPTTFITLTTT